MAPSTLQRLDPSAADKASCQHGYSGKLLREGCAVALTYRVNIRVFVG